MSDSNETILFRGKYRIPSTRLRGWDYASAGLYFVTICVKHRVPCLSEIVNGAVHLSPIGEIVAEEWQRTAHIRANVVLDAWVIMPNHLHGIIGITAPDVDTAWRDDDDARRDDDDVRRGDDDARRDDARRDDDDARRDDDDARRDDARRGVTVETPRLGVSTMATAAASAAWKSNSLGAIIGQFKSVCTKRIWRAGYRDFEWQARFYDRIIRNERALNRIRAYIANNPARWEADRNNPENVWM